MNSFYYSRNVEVVAKAVHQHELRLFLENLLSSSFSNENLPLRWNKHQKIYTHFHLFPSRKDVYVTKYFTKKSQDNSLLQMFLVKQTNERQGIKNEIFMKAPAQQFHE